jgi:hypothetical protein
VSYHNTPERKREFSKEVDKLRKLKLGLGILGLGAVAGALVGLRLNRKWRHRFECQSGCSCCGSGEAKVEGCRCGRQCCCGGEGCDCKD